MAKGNAKLRSFYNKTTANPAIKAAQIMRDSSPSLAKFVKQGLHSNSEFIENRDAFNAAINDLESKIGMAPSTPPNINVGGTIDDVGGLDDIATELIEESADNIPNNPSSVNLGKLKQLGSKLLGYAKENPGKTLGAATLGAGNLAGLLDNEYWGGQAIGGGLGAAIPTALNLSGVANINPYWSAMISMGGGVLGSLFDKLRAKKAEEQAMAQQYQGQY